MFHASFAFIVERLCASLCSGVALVGGVSGVSGVSGASGVLVACGSEQ